MRFLVMLLVFVMAAPTVMGAMIIPLTDPAWGFDGWKYFPYAAAAGAVVALPVSYVISGIIMKRVEAAAAK
ncbi:MAG: hypothetical protein RIC14_15345 [Filomicrobium sp.]